MTRASSSGRDELAAAMAGRQRVDRIVSERALERDDRTMAQLADYGSDDDKRSSQRSSGPAKPDDEHVLTAENILRTSPVYDLHRTVMAGAEVGLPAKCLFCSSCKCAWYHLRCVCPD